MKNKILAAVICCEFKEYSLQQCLRAIKKAEFEDVLLNFEGELPAGLIDYDYLQNWVLETTPTQKRQYDQDQSYRLSRIVTARNMVIDWAVAGDYDWIFFVDSDVIIPENTISELFENNEYKLKSGLVKGRGAHSFATYLSYPQEQVGKWTRCHYATCGFMAIHRSLFRKVRFKWGEAFDTDILCSEDPLYGADCRYLFDEWWWVNTALKSEHLGDLDGYQVSTY